jgi:L-fuconolactonase
VIDSHHHQWDATKIRYEEFATNELLQGVYGASEYMKATSDSCVAGSVCVEATSAGADPGQETDWLLREAARVDGVLGVVAWAPVEAYGIERYLDRLKRKSPVRIVGVRRSFEFEDPAVIVSKHVIRGVRALGERGLPFDLLVPSRGMTEADRLVRACEGVQFVLDHVGNPPIKNGDFRTWRDQLTRLAASSNVACKISGLGVLSDAARWTLADIEPYLNHAVDAFGWERLMYGSDWPVVLLAGGIAKWFDAISAFAVSVGSTDRRKMFSENAIRIYALDAVTDCAAGGKDSTEVW